MHTLIWSDLFESCMHLGRVVRHLKIGGIDGVIVRLQETIHAEQLEARLCPAAWKKGVCCQTEVYSNLNDVSSGAEIDNPNISHLWDKVSAHVALFKSIQRGQMFDVCSLLTDSFTESEYAAISNCLQPVEWFSPRYVGNRVLRFGVPEESISDTAILAWIDSYRDVVFQIFGEAPSKRTIINVAKASKSVYFCDFGSRI